MLLEARESFGRALVGRHGEQRPEAAPGEQGRDLKRLELAREHLHVLEEDAAWNRLVVAGGEGERRLGADRAVEVVVGDVELLGCCRRGRA